MFNQDDRSVFSVFSGDKPLRTNWVHSKEEFNRLNDIFNADFLTPEEPFIECDTEDEDKEQLQEEEYTEEIAGTKLQKVLGIKKEDLKDKDTLDLLKKIANGSAGLRDVTSTKFFNVVNRLIGSSASARQLAGKNRTPVSIFAVFNNGTIVAGNIIDGGKHCKASAYCAAKKVTEDVADFIENAKDNFQAKAEESWTGYIEDKNNAIYNVTKSTVGKIVKKIGNFFKKAADPKSAETGSILITYNAKTVQDLLKEIQGLGYKRILELEPDQLKGFDVRMDSRVEIPYSSEEKKVAEKIVNFLEKDTTEDKVNNSEPDETKDDSNEETNQASEEDSNSNTDEEKKNDETPEVELENGVVGELPTPKELDKLGIEDKTLQDKVADKLLITYNQNADDWKISNRDFLKDVYKAIKSADSNKDLSPKEVVDVANSIAVSVGCENVKLKQNEEGKIAITGAKESKLAEISKHDLIKKLRDVQKELMNDTWPDKALEDPIPGNEVADAIVDSLKKNELIPESRNFKSKKLKENTRGKKMGKDAKQFKKLAESAIRKIKTLKESEADDLIDLFRFDMLENTIFLESPEDCVNAGLGYSDLLDCLEEVFPTWAGIDTVEKARHVLETSTDPSAATYLQMLNTAVANAKEADNFNL